MLPGFFLLRARGLSTVSKKIINYEAEFLSSIVRGDFQGFIRNINRGENYKYLSSIKTPTLFFVASEFKKTSISYEQHRIKDQSGDDDYNGYAIYFQTVTAHLKMLKELRQRHASADYSKPLAAESREFTGISPTATAMSILASIDHEYVGEHFSDIMDSAKKNNSFDELKIDGDCKIDAPLISAIQSGCENTIYSLLLFGADPNVTDANKNSALELALSLGRHRTVALLVKYGAVTRTSGKLKGPRCS